MTFPELPPNNPRIVRKTTVDEYGFVIEHSIEVIPPAEPITPKPLPRVTRKPSTPKKPPRRTSPPVILSARPPQRGPNNFELATARLMALEDRKRNIPHAKQFKAPTRRKARCPNCACKLRADRLDEHLRRVHGVTTSDIANSVPSTVRSLTEAPELPFSSTPLPIQDTTKVLTASVLVQCPQCTAKVRSDRLDRHVRRVHSTPAQKRPYKNIENPSDQAQQRHTRNAVMDDHEQDGGKYLGFMARENGRFGSLPMFDDYSDEAGAD